MRVALLFVFCAACSNAAAPSEQVIEATTDDDTAAPETAVVEDSARDEVRLDEIGATPCAADMVAISDTPSFCIDRYEAPNVAGAEPLAFRTAPEGEAWCAARGKRLCTEAEWLRACQGPAKLPYPYGGTYERGACNDDKTWIAPSWSTLGTYPSDASKAEAARLYQADPSGSRTQCSSSEGVFDLAGNVAEWVTRSFPNANNYDHVLKGCYWSGCYGGSKPGCAFVNPAHPGTFRTYEAGFRCCR